MIKIIYNEEWISIHTYDNGKLESTIHVDKIEYREDGTYTYRNNKCVGYIQKDALLDIQNELKN